MRPVPVTTAALVLWALLAAPAQAQRPDWLPDAPAEAQAGAGTGGDVTTGTSGPGEAAEDAAGGPDTTTAARTTEAGSPDGDDPTEPPPDLMDVCADLDGQPEIQAACVAKAEQ